MSLNACNDPFSSDSRVRNAPAPITPFSCSSKQELRYLEPSGPGGLPPQGAHHPWTRLRIQGASPPSLLACLRQPADLRAPHSPPSPGWPRWRRGEGRPAARGAAAWVQGGGEALKLGRGLAGRGRAHWHEAGWRGAGGNPGAEGRCLGA